MKQGLVGFLTLGLVVSLAGCGGGGDGTGPTGGNGTPDPGGRVILVSPSLQTNIQEIFDRRGCSGSLCHGAARSADLDLRSGSAFASLVNVVAFSDANFQRVTPNDAQNSYLVMKLEGRQTVGVRMPLGLAPLDAIDLTNVRNWINTGALDN